MAAEERTKADRGGGAGVPPAADYEAVIVVEGVKQVLSTALPKALSQHHSSCSLADPLHVIGALAAGT